MVRILDDWNPRVFEARAVFLNIADVKDFELSVFSFPPLALLS